MVDVVWLTGLVKQGEIWQLNFWIWILQAEGNYVKIKYSIKKLTSLRYFMWNNFYFLAFRLILVSQVHTIFYPFRYRYFTELRFGIQNFNQIGNRWYFQLVEEKTFFAWEYAWEESRGLRNFRGQEKDTGWYVCRIWQK